MDLSITRESDVRRTRKLADIFGFKDDRAAINDGEEPKRSCKEFHLPRLHLKKGKYRFF